MSFFDTKRGGGRNKRISSERPFLNGKDIESQISGYETLTVSGRSFLGYEINSDEADGMDGKVFNEASLSERVITVKFSLETANSADYMQKMNALTDILSMKQFDLYFGDESDWHFTGTVTSFTELEEGKLRGVGGFEITCTNPYKYSLEKTLQGTIVSLPNVKGEIVEIRYNATKTVNKIKIKHSLGFTLETAEGTVNSGDSLIFRPQEQIITLNGVDKTQWLAYTSDFENIPLGGTLTSEPSGALTVKYRERR